MSRSLSGRASPRARDPKIASLVTPSALIAGAISRNRAMICSRVMSATSLMRRYYHISEKAQLLRRLAMPQSRVELVDQLLRGIGDHRTGREDRLGACLVQRVVVLRRHHAADDDHDVVPALLFQRGLYLGHCGEVGGRERGQAEDVHVVL